MINQSKKIVNLLRKKKLKISFAESCTGGLLSSAITSVNGSSKVFNLGFVTYSNQSKNSVLKVPKKIIRKYIGFKGVIISDDLSMKALRYGLKENAIRALNAGCNLVLHCNGNMQEMSKIIKAIPKIDNFVIKKTKQFYNFLR